MSKLLLAAAGLAASANAKVYFKETFESTSAWTPGFGNKDAAEVGSFSLVSPQFSGKTGDKVIKTGPDARHFGFSAPIESFDNAGKDLVISYTVKHEQELDCGGAYIKLAPKVTDPKSFSGETPYSIMFGPDVCGYGTRKTHVIFTDRKGVNHQTKKSVKVETDKLSHRYTLIVRPDNTYEVQIDGSKVESGNVAEDFPILPPKTIKDPASIKPSDWVDAAQIPDPTDVKPVGYDDTPPKIVDPAATKPEDWDDEEDGEWEAPTIDNPAFKGPFKPKMIANPDYKGPWVQAEIPNPDYKPEDAPTVYNVCHPCEAVGFELWQVKAGTTFDDIIVTDSIVEAEAFAAETFDKKKGPEKEAFDAAEAAKKAADEAKAAEAKASAETAEDEDDDNDEL